jgi:REP element-mobilizing transposase RayT
MYFVTVCTQNRQCLFGEIVNRQMQLNEFGNIVYDEWVKTQTIRKNIKLDEFIVMPNHLHGIIQITDDIIDSRGTARRAPTLECFGKPVSGSIPTIIRAFKSAVTKRINEIRDTPRIAIWQCNYYEHIIRNEDNLNRVRQYIIDNPQKWDNDTENPDNINTNVGANGH